MKRTILLAVVSLAVLASCGSSIPEMSLDVKTTSKSIEEQSKSPRLSNMVAGGPLYVFDAGSTNPTLKAYRELREKRAADIVKMTGELREQLEETMDVMPAYRSTLITFLSNLAASVDIAKPEQAEMATYALDTIDRSLKAAVKTSAAYANMESMAQAIEKTKVPENVKDNAIMPMYEYAEYVLIQKLSDEIAYELTYLPARAASITVVVKGNEKVFGKQVRKLVKKFDKKFGKRLAKVSAAFQDAISTQMDIAVGFDSLASADYAFLMASLEFAKKKLPEITKQAAEVRTSEIVSQEDKDFYGTYSKFLAAFTDQMSKGMESYAPPRFLEDLDHFASRPNLIPAFEGVAYAGVTDWLEKTSSALTAGLSGAGEKMYGVASSAVGCATSPWQCTKAAAGKAANVAYTVAKSSYDVADATAEATGAKAAFKFGQKAAGVVVDCASIPAILISNEAAGLYYGTSRRETALRGAEQLTQMFKSWDEGKPGSVTLKGGIEALGEAEKSVGSAVETAVGGVLGGVTSAGGYVLDKVTPQIVKDGATALTDGADWLGKKATGYSIKETFTTANAGWVAGKLGEMTTGMVTGFGKGMMQLANPDSDAGDLAEGAINVAFSFIGGSKALVKASQVEAGLKKMGEELVEKGSKMASQLELKLQNKAIQSEIDDIYRAAQNGLNPSQASRVAAKEAEIAANELQKQVLAQQEKSLGQIFGELKDKAKQKVLGNLDEAKEGAGNFVNKGFDASMQGMKEAAGEITGKTFKDYADNILGGMADGVIGGLAKEGVLSMVGANDKDAIDKAERSAPPWWGMSFDPNDPAVKEAMAKVAKVMEETKKELESLPEMAKKIGDMKAKEYVTEELVKEATKEADKRLTTAVSATGSFSGDYRGSVSLTLTPGGGPVSGTVTTKYGSAGISGSVSKDGRLTANVSGSMSYDWYGDDGRLNTPVKKSCTLSASMSGAVGAHRASGTYHGSCAKENDAGSWTASW